MQTMVDRLASAPSRPGRLLHLLQDGCFVLIEISRLLISSLFIVLGLPLGALLLLVGGRLNLLLAQLGNLAAHYDAADAVRRSAFAGDLADSAVAAAVVVLALRAPRALKHLKTALAPARAAEAVDG